MYFSSISEKISSINNMSGSSRGSKAPLGAIILVENFITIISYLKLHSQVNERTMHALFKILKIAFIQESTPHTF